MKINMDFRYSFKFILFVYILSALVGGYALAIVGGISGDIAHRFDLNKEQLGVLLGLVFLGGVFAKAVWLAADYIGRKAMIVSFVVMYIIATYIFVEAQTYNVLVFARLMQGGAILLCTYAFPVYMTEIAPPELRGRYVTIFQLVWTAGMCASGIMIFAFYETFVWNQYLYVTIFVAVVLACLSCFLPSSPTWLMLKKRVHDAYEVIQKTQPNLTDEEIKKHIDDIRVSLRDHKPRSFLQKLFIGKDIFPVMLVTLLLILNQLTGINFILFSSGMIIAPLTTSLSVIHAINFLLLGVNFGATIITMFFIDKWGRKEVLFLGLKIALVSMFGLIVVYSLPIMQYNYIVVIGLLITCIAGLAFGPCGVIITLINELLPNRVRITGIFMAGMVSMLFSFYFVGYFLRVGEYYNYSLMFGILFVSSSIYYWVVKRLIPETAGKTLEEIEAEI